MSLKFAALGSLTILGPPARADDQVQHLRPVLITFGRGSSKAEPKKPEAGVIKREARVCDRS